MQDISAYPDLGYNYIPPIRCQCCGIARPSSSSWAEASDRAWTHLDDCRRLESSFLAALTFLTALASRSSLSSSESSSSTAVALPVERLPVEKGASCDLASLLLFACIEAAA